MDPLIERLQLGLVVVLAAAAAILSSGSGASGSAIEYLEGAVSPTNVDYGVSITDAMGTPLP